MEGLPDEPQAEPGPRCLVRRGGRRLSRRVGGLRNRDPHPRRRLQRLQGDGDPGPAHRRAGPPAHRLARGEEGERMDAGPARHLGPRERAPRELRALRPRLERGARAAPAVDREAARKRFRFQKTLREFLVEEKALASVEPSDRDAGVLWVAGGGSREKGVNPGVPALVMAAEHYNRLSRLLDRKMEVELEIDVKARFHDDDEMAYNTIA